MIHPTCATEPTIPTPCIGICVMDDDGFCAGCARTIDEIGGWSLLSSSARMAIMEKLSARKAASGSDSAL